MNTTTNKAIPWLLLFVRTLLFLGVQALFAFGLAVGGVAQAWSASAAWWPLGVTLVNLICLAVMIFAIRISA